MSPLDELTAKDRNDLNAMFLSDGFAKFISLLEENFGTVSENILLQAGEPEFDARDLNILRGRALTLMEIEQLRLEIEDLVKKETEEIFTLRDTHRHGWLSDHSEGPSLYDNGGKQYFIDPRGGV